MVINRSEIVALQRVEVVLTNCFKCLRIVDSYRARRPVGNIRRHLCSRFNACAWNAADNNTAEAAAVIKIFFIIFVVLYLLFKAIAVPLLLDNKKERLLMFSIQSGNR